MGITNASERKIEFKVESFREIPNPYRTEKDDLNVPHMYVAICDVKNIPGNIPMKTNPREQNLKTGVAKKIKNSLIGTDQNFYLLNRGLLLSAKAVSWDRYTNKMSVDFGNSESDEEIYGDVDGGHTYKIILNCQDEIDAGRQYVKIEILTGVENFFEDLAEARNSSTPVKQTSIADLKKKFALIQETIADRSYASNISYHENENKDITIQEILAILNMFNIDNYGVEIGSHAIPTISYTSNKACVDAYLKALEKYTGANETKNPYWKMRPIMKDIFNLYDHLEENMPDYYRKANENGKFGSVKGVLIAKKEGMYKLKFSQRNTQYSIAKGFLYPVLGAFRAIVIEKDGKYCWAVQNPIAMMDEVGPTLVQSVIDRSRSLGNNPNAVGKDSQQWLSLFQTVLIQRLMKGGI